MKRAANTATFVVTELADPFALRLGMTAVEFAHLAQTFTTVKTAGRNYRRAQSLSLLSSAGTVIPAHFCGFADKVSVPACSAPTAMAPLLFRRVESGGDALPTNLVVVFSSGGSMTTFTTTPISIVTTTTLHSTAIKTVTTTPVTTRIFPDVFTSGDIVISSTFTDSYPGTPTTEVTTEVTAVPHSITTFPASLTVTDLNQFGFQWSLPTTTASSPPRSSGITAQDVFSTPVIVGCSVFLGFSVILAFLYRRARVRKVKGRSQPEAFQVSEGGSAILNRSGETVMTLDNSQRRDVDVGVIDEQRQQWDKLARERDASSHLAPALENGGMQQGQNDGSTRVEVLRVQLTTIQSQLDAALAEGGGGEAPPAYDYRASRQALNQS